MEAIVDNKIGFLKEKLKTLAVLQTKTKRARKTSLPKGEWLLLKAEIITATTRLGSSESPYIRCWDHDSAASDAKLRKIEITACLNLYHELRGSTYRHAGEGYWYDKTMEALRTELKSQ